MAHSLRLPNSYAGNSIAHVRATVTRSSHLAAILCREGLSSHPRSSPPRVSRQLDYCAALLKRRLCPCVYVSLKVGRAAVVLNARMMNGAQLGYTCSTQSPAESPISRHLLQLTTGRCSDERRWNEERTKERESQRRDTNELV